MPKIKSGASGRRRDRQQQRRELKSAGGGSARSEVRSGRGFRHDQAWTEFWAREVTSIRTPAPGARRSGDSGAPAVGPALCLWLPFRRKDGFSVSVLAPSMTLMPLVHQPAFSYLGRSNIYRILFGKLRLFHVVFQDSGSTQGLGSTF